MKPWWVRLARYAKPHGFSLLALMALMLGGVALTALTPWPMKLIIDYVIPSRPLPANLEWIYLLPGLRSPNTLLICLVVGTILLFVANRAVSITQKYIESGVATRMMYALGGDLFDHLQSLSLRMHGGQQVGDLMRRVTTDNRCVRDLLLGVLLPVFSSLVSLVAMFIIMWRLDRSLSLLALLAAIPLPLLIKRLTPRMTEFDHQQRQLEGEMIALAEQNLTALPIIQGFSREEHEDKRFRRLSDATFLAYLRTLYAEVRFKIAVNTPTALGTGAMIALGGLHVLQGSITVGSLLVFLAYLDSLYGPMAALAHLSSGYASAAASARRVLEILEADDGVRDAPGARPLPIQPRGQSGHVRFENVTFGYESDRSVLNGITLEARPGETVALVGPTGAGKTTLASMIPRFFDPWEGRVLVDGVDIREVQLSSLRSHIALVLQEPFLLPLTIAENIAYGRPDASREEVIAAAVAANADGFIGRLRNGYDTGIAERGATLSGGEKQRIAIARALLKDAPILILDEPTSALDAKTESLLLEALERLMVGRTTFIIAHRLSTIRRADKIVVIDSGQIAESGTHEELMAANKLYRRYNSLQRDFTSAIVSHS